MAKNGKTGNMAKLQKHAICHLSRAMCAPWCVRRSGPVAPKHFFGPADWANPYIPLRRP